jgi:spermidine/putrescine transport system ATP-binding protein
MSVPAVEVRAVDKRFGDNVALKDIELTVDQNEFVSLLGPSGCGKTTLLRIISGFEEPTHGRVFVMGDDVTDVPPHRRPTNIVFQRGALFPHMNVAANIGYSLKLRGWPRAKIAARVEEMLSLVRLEGLGQRGPTELSGGQIQRAALARALAAEPSVLLLDEPLSALDLKLRQHMQLELRSIQRELGATFVYVTHDQTEALVMSDRIAVMNRGQIIQEGTPREIYTHPGSVFASDFIGETNLIEGTVHSRDDGIVVLATRNGTLVQGAATANLVEEASAVLSVRPESVRIRQVDRGDEHAVDGPRSVGGELTGIVAQVVYLGSRLRVGVDIGGEAVVWADLRDEEAVDLIEGVRVTLSWRPSATSVWAQETEGEGTDG